jgi:hypothetical protein
VLHTLKMEAPDSSEHWEMFTRLHRVIFQKSVILLSTPAKTSELDCQGPTQQPALHRNLQFKLPPSNRSDALNTQCAVSRLLLGGSCLRTGTNSVHICNSVHSAVTVACYTHRSWLNAQANITSNIKGRTEAEGVPDLGAADDVSA